jgi:hypothetical protein
VGGDGGAGFHRWDKQTQRYPQQDPNPNYATLASLSTPHAIGAHLRIGLCCSSNSRNLQVTGFHAVNYRYHGIREIRALFPWITGIRTEPHIRPSSNRQSQHD